MRKFFAVVAVVAILSIATLAFRNNEHQVSPPSSLSNGSGSNNSSSNTTSTQTAYKDGTFTGSIANAYYGNIQVSVQIQSGKIVNVNFLQFPNDNPTSYSINQQADPYLKQEAISAQNAQVNVISGATFSSQAFIQSLTSALSQA